MDSTVIPMNLGADSYDIILERGVLRRAGEILNLRRKVMIVSDSGVPGKWTRALADQCEKAEVFRIPAGEENGYVMDFIPMYSHICSVELYIEPFRHLSQINSLFELS